MATFQDLQSQVDRTKAAIGTAVTIINGIPAKVAAAVAAAGDGAVDQVAFDALTAELTAATDQLVVTLNAAQAPVVPQAATA